MRCTATLALLSATTFAAAEPVQTLGGCYSADDDRRWGVPIPVTDDRSVFVTVRYAGYSEYVGFGWEARIEETAFLDDVRFASELDANGRVVIARLAPGAEIGPAIDTGFDFGVFAYVNDFDGISGGAWLDRAPGIVGFSFLGPDRERRYAWAEVEVENDEDPDAGALRVRRIAYESVAGVPIAAGDIGEGCYDAGLADLAEPFGVLDLADITAFITAFMNGDPRADLAEPFGVLDIPDVLALVNTFVGNCPVGASHCGP